MSELREITLLGSTGSIGTQAIDIITANPDRFAVTALGAGGGNPRLLAEQAIALAPKAVGIADESAAEPFLQAYKALGGKGAPEIVTGPEAMADLAGRPGSGPGNGGTAHTVLNGVNGSLGLAPTLAALKAGHTLALANKESLIAGGPLVAEAAAPGQIVPVDSEHSALAQSLRSGTPGEVAKLIVTASGGPFRGRKRSELENVTVEEALAHPTWAMGPVITINSATMMNKSLEVIEAHELFGVPYDRIEVTVHPQSVVHSLVEFADGNTIAQASPPDMRLPISHALAWPGRVPGSARPVDWTRSHTWTFEPLDDEAFPAVALAREVGTRGGVYPAIFNASNEEAVEAFRRGAISFTGIVDTVADVVAAAPEFAAPRDIADVLAAEDWARARAREILAG
ncbi:1-deoxy-D-xylulose-5-phosphate reductoisomerase [Salininema proteolyticum]|uniref:1-deoxy-D-xylulose 5-phosphate reductoisomerase n=1 Tax=Salininema proteolyticum TaxID=1607685 RepID=A0ABV8U0V3_9ACTN